MSDFTRRVRAFRDALLAPLGRILPKHLTVLGYHRISAADEPGFSGYPGNAGPGAAGFEQQLDFMTRHYDAIGLHDLLAWLRGEGPLPERPLLLVFDDGYRDQLTLARPALDARGISALFAVATDYVGGQRAFAWDYAADALLRTRRGDRVELPLLGPCDLGAERGKIAVRFVRALKALSGAALQEALGALAQRLDVPPWGAAPAGLHLDWDDLRALARGGHAIAAHGRTHASLAWLSPEAMRSEIESSRSCIEREIGAPVAAFVYPYGRSQDFDAGVEAELRRQGFELAFAARGGISFLGELRRHPFAVRRVLVGAGDRGRTFAARIGPAARLRSR